MNRGQVLVVFLLVIPVLIVSILFVSNIFYQKYQKQKATNEIKQAINYYFEADNKSASLDIIEEKLADYQLQIIYSDNQITLLVDYELKSVLGESKIVKKIYTGENQQIRKGY